MKHLHTLLAATLLTCPAWGAAQGDGRDLTGFWSPDYDQHPVDQDMLDKLPGDTVILDDAGYVEFVAGEYGGLEVKQPALDAAADWNPADALSLQNVCKTPSVIYTMQGPFPIEIHQTSDVVVMKLEYFDQVRVIYMDGRDHPPADAPHSNLGHSIGRWEGDELVIETTHILPSTLTNNGLDHSENVRFVERYKVGEDGETLMSTQWFEDPEVLDTPGARFMKWSRDPDGYVLPYSCDPTFAVDYDKVDRSEDVDAAEYELAE